MYCRCPAVQQPSCPYHLWIFWLSYPIYQALSNFGILYLSIPLLLSRSIWILDLNNFWNILKLLELVLEISWSPLLYGCPFSGHPVDWFTYFFGSSGYKVPVHLYLNESESLSALLLCLSCLSHIISSFSLIYNN